MEAKINEIEINGEKYVKASDVKQLATPLDGKPYCIVRTYSSGVFAGYVESREGQEVVLVNARRIWKWEGAASLSQLATSGTSQPAKCMFPEPVARVTLLQAIEIIDCTEVGKKSIEGVSIWKK